MSPPGHDRAAGLDAPNPLSLYLKLSLIHI